MADEDWVPERTQIRAGRDRDLRLACPGCTPIYSVEGAVNVGALLHWVQDHGVERHGATPLVTLLASVDNALRNGSDMTNANLAFELLCERLGVNRDALVFDPGWARRR